ncbi:hypothetical protein PsorP6_015936 [Peronosclerospora sorghi]|uniref:Uncharacterized protein n=1 Tax=Peronosclerospora sorghi TaxID=230839 RepID=A0ACC0WNC3_9STRA|nr:hypothetical protein PsorP6_015936 [Peronosclerospora sorghi]
MTAPRARILGALALCLLVPSFLALDRVWLVHLHPRLHPRAFSLPSRLSRAARRQRVYETCATVVQDAQRSVARVITAHARDESVEIQPLWLQNTLVVRSNDERPALTRWFEHELRHVPGVVDVEQDTHVLTLLDAQGAAQEDDTKDARIESNVQLLHAPALWATGARGRGVVVASIDSGVRYTHEALRDTFRGTMDDGRVNFDYAFWFPPGTDMSKETPETADPVGHGTHTMGTAVGGHGIGIAPDATWITARAFDLWGAANKSNFLFAAQWVVCPTKMNGKDADCSRGADVVTNSFGVDRSTPAYPQWTWMSKVIDAWRAAGVYPVFASGNTNGFLCGSVYYPGSQEDTIAVGALIGGFSLWGASGKGPSLEEARGFDHRPRRARSKYIIKPDFVAPGVGIRSALSVQDSAYTRLTGTSMATPHVAGALALVLGLTHTHAPAYATIVQSLTSTTTRSLHKPFLVPSACGNTTYADYPNNLYGWGLVNVCAAAKYLGFPCHEASRMQEEEAETLLLSLAEVVAIE